MSSVLILKSKKETKLAAPKTTPVIFKDGTVGRGVKLSAKNIVSIGSWVGNSFKELNVPEVKLSLYQNGGRQVRVAKLGDTVVKTEAGFTVIKAVDFEKYIKI